MNYLTDPTFMSMRMEYLPKGAWGALAGWGLAWYFVGSAFRVMLG